MFGSRACSSVGPEADLEPTQVYNALMYNTVLPFVFDIPVCVFAGPGAHPKANPLSPSFRKSITALRRPIDPFVQRQNP